MSGSPLQFGSLLSRSHETVRLQQVYIRKRIGLDTKFWLHKRQACRTRRVRPGDQARASAGSAGTLCLYNDVKLLDSPILEANVCPGDSLDSRSKGNLPAPIRSTVPTSKIGICSVTEPPIAFDGGSRSEPCRTRSDHHGFMPHMIVLHSLTASLRRAEPAYGNLVALALQGVGYRTPRAYGCRLITARGQRGVS